ncbi:MAG: hypothetical protein ACJAYS_001065 [Lentimonas sp.]|jgi:hypothetical protein
METQEFKTEWCLLQNQFDSYEKHSLYIKLLSITVLLMAGMSDGVSIFVVLLLMVLWLQDAIWKTFQSRIEIRLLQIEKYISEESETSVFQFNSEFHKVRLGGLSLVNEYIRQSIRPTVAFPYVVLILISLAQCVL